MRHEKGCCNVYADVVLFVPVQSLKVAIFLYSVCHVVLVVMDSLDSPDILFRFLWTAEQMKSNCLRLSTDASELS